MSRIEKEQQRIVTKKIIKNVLDILEKEDNWTLEEKELKVSALLHKELELLNKIPRKGGDGTINHLIKEKFFHSDFIGTDSSIYLRRVLEKDKEMFLKLEKENAWLPLLFEKESFKQMLWEDYAYGAEMMLCSIVSMCNDNYIGYCGIKNIFADDWEIVIELLSNYVHQGIGYRALLILLEQIKSKLEITSFFVRISPDNYASQALFEKLGAIPDGICESLLHNEKEIQQFEKENVGYIDDKLIAVAEKFGVKPCALLSHVLKYRLE